MTDAESVLSQGAALISTSWICLSAHNVHFPISFIEYFQSHLAHVKIFLQIQFIPKVKSAESISQQ